VARLLRCEVPPDARTGRVALPLPRADLRDKDVTLTDSAIQTLPTQHADFDFHHIEPEPQGRARCSADLPSAGRRIEAHIFIAFLAYCLQVTLRQRLRAFAPGLTPRSVFEKFAAVQMIDVQVPTTDGREIVLTRYTEPKPELKLLLGRLRLDLPAQPPPKITAAAP
jgi:hypothetical protein